MKIISIILLLIACPLMTFAENLQKSIILNITAEKDAIKGVLMNRMQSGDIKYSPDVVEKTDAGTPTCFFIYYKLKDKDVEFGPYAPLASSGGMRIITGDADLRKYADLGPGKSILYTGKLGEFLWYLKRFKWINPDTIESVRFECIVYVKIFSSKSKESEFLIKKETPWFLLEKNDRKFELKEQCPQAGEGSQKRSGVVYQFSGFF
jgi:hypothetical protein